MNPFPIPAAVAAFLLIFLAFPAAAQEGRGRIVTVGGGIQIVPKYPGADDHGFSPLPYVDVRRVGEPPRFEAADESFGIRLLGETHGFSFGPIIGLQGEREEDDVGAPVGDVGFTVEPGAYVQFWPAPSVRVRAEARRGLGGHDGWVGDISADLVLRNDNVIFGIGPRLRWSDAQYQRAYFGVTPAAAAASPLPAYSPGGGIHAAGAIASVTHQFNARWGVYGYAGYDRLIGDAADSPIVRQIGSRDQFSAGLALTYTFNIGGS